MRPATYFKDLLIKLVNQRSWTLNSAGVNLAQDIFVAALSGLDLKVERIACPERGDFVVADTQALAANPATSFILLSGHIDTAQPEDSPMQHFYEEGGRWYGPGVYDMKAGLALIVTSLHSLIADGFPLASLPLRIVCNPAEENPTAASREMLRSYARGASKALVFEMGRTGNGIVLERFGLRSYSIKVTGKRANVGNNFRDGASAIYSLARIITGIEALSDVDRGILANVGKVSGGIANGTVPDAAECTFQVRYATKALERETDPHIAALPKLASDGTTAIIQPKDSYHPLEATPASEALCQHYIECAQAVGLSRTRFPRVGGGSDANDIADLQFPIIDSLGLPGGGAHTGEEYLEPGELLKHVENLKEFLRRA